MHSPASKPCSQKVKKVKSWDQRCVGGRACWLPSQPSWAPSEIYESLRRAEFRRDEAETFSLFLDLGQEGPGN